MTGSSNWWLPTAFRAVVQALCLKQPSLQPINSDQVLARMDEAGLSRLVDSLPPCRPAEVSKQIEKAGGPEVLSSQANQAAMSSWSTIHQAARVLNQLSKAVPALLRAYRQGSLINSHAILRVLPVLAMSCFVPGSEVLRDNIAAILKVSTKDAPGLIKNFRTAALSGDAAVLAVDQLIQADPVWAGWSQVFLREGKGLCRPPRPITHWEFPDTQISERNGSSICGWLFRRS